MAMAPDTEKHGPSVKGLERGLEVLDYLFTVPDAPIPREPPVTMATSLVNPNSIFRFLLPHRPE